MGNFSFSDTGDTDAAETEELEYDHELSENVVNDLVEYGRSDIVRNEEQFALGTLGYLTGFMSDPSHFVCWVMIGTAGSGKSHIQNVIEKLFPDSYLYKATSGSDKSIIYDDTWDEAYIAALDELQKPSDEIIEILKSLHGGEDEEFRYKVTSDGRGADRNVDEIVREPLPFSFLYAQYDPDFELWDRMLKIPVHESEEKNEGVVATQWDHKMVSFGDTDASYMFDFEDGKKALQDHVRNMPKDARVKIPAGEEEFGWDAVEHVKPIFDINRSETNRVSGMVANLVRASCLLNHENRETKRLKVDDEVVECYIAEPQDVANILACRDVLLATTHQLDRKKKAICLAIEEKGGTTNAASIPDIIEYLRETNASFVKRTQVEAMLQDLIDNHLVEKMERAGENGAHLYKFNGFHQLGKLKINDRFQEVFDGCYDPIAERNFIESAKQQNEDLRPSMADFMSETSVSTDSEEARKGQATLTGEEQKFDLTPLQEAVRSHLHDTLDSQRVEGLDEREPSLQEMLGVIDLGDDPEMFDETGTIFDPDNEVWLHEVGVETLQDAEERINDTMTKLMEKGVWETEVKKARGSQPLVMEVSVAPEDAVK